MCITHTKQEGQKMKKYCIQQTDLSNGAKIIITNDFRNEFTAREILAQKMARYIRSKTEITENGGTYFCYRTKQGTERMLAVIEH